MRFFLLAVLVTCACADPQYVKSRYSGTKGGYSGSGYQAGENLVRYYNNTQGGGYYSGYNQTQAVNYEKGVCYIEVPTASIAKDPAHIPAGNGSRPDLSRIRSCCQGYIRNIHNYKICDPVCTNECINALCTEPETCTCFPQHVRNLAGICVPICPIGCQNGRCAGGECMCNNGYTLDSMSRYCIPICRANCGGNGNCTAPNTCECKKGYTSSPDGSCKPHCDRCGTNSQCVAPNDCRCLPGYTKNPQGDCIPQCVNDCRPNGRCVAPNKCEYPTTTTTTIRPIGQPNSNYPGQYYPGNQQSNYSGNQPSNYPGNQPSNYPGNQQPYYPGYHQPGYQPGQSNQPGYPNNQNPNYPGNRPTDSSNQQHNNPNVQPIYYNPGQQPNVYPGNQQSYYPQRPNTYPDNQQQNPNQPSNNYYPGGQYYPSNQQTYPGNQYYPQYPNQQQGHFATSNQSYANSSYTSYQQGQYVYPDSQLENIETLCSKPCVNGICLQTNRCVCNDGYVLDDSDPTVSRCNPYCPGGCPNGVCSSPNFCICNMGYYKDHSVKGRANCVKRVRRSAEAPVNVPELLVFEIPENELDL